MLPFEGRIPVILRVPNLLVDLTGNEAFIGGTSAADGEK
jgi:hypothetical protein